MNQGIKAKPPSFDARTTRRFLEYMIDPATGVAELRIFRAGFDRRSRGIVAMDQFAVTLGGWYDNIDDMICDLTRVDGVSTYLTVNPVKPYMLATSPNKLARLKKEEGTSDDDIKTFRRMFIDIDPPLIDVNNNGEVVYRKRKDGINSTAEEMAVAIEVRDRILREEPDIARSAIWGGSGNGGFIFAHLPDYDTKNGRSLVERAVARLKRKYEVNGVEIDVKCKNPARIGPIPGTVKCKGPHLPDRPRRLVTLDSPEGWEVVPIDLEAWIGAEPEPEPEDTGKRSRRGGTATQAVAVPAGPPPDRYDNRVRRARAYVMSSGFPESIDGQNGHGTLYRCACELIDEFGLDRGDALAVLHEFNQAKAKPPEDDYQVEHKIDEAIRLHPVPSLRRLMEKPAGNDAAAEGKDMDLDIPEGMEEDPHRLARIVIARYNHAAGRLIHYWNEEFWTWRDSYYAVVPREEMKAEVTCIVHDEFVRIYAAELLKFKGKTEKDAGDEDAPKRRKPKLRSASTRLIGDVIQALKSLAILFIEDVPSQPAWLAKGNEWRGQDILPARNALIHLPSYAENLPHSIPSTPQFFNSYALSYDVESLEMVREPTLWLEFLEQLWPDSPESIELLQEWFGYMLTPDTSYQKILVMIGDKRSGKGTIARILTQVVGEANVVNPTLGSLTTPFGLHPLFGKAVAIVSDARLSHRQDRQLIVERLLSISGEDMQTIDRKHRDSITVKLPTRFLIVSNEVPNLKDPSGAFASRTLCLELTQSFLGRENRKLSQQLSGELPQIFAWSVAGWRRLRDRGHFVQPAAARELVEEMDDVSSRIRTFVREVCVLQPDDEDCTVQVNTLYGRWKLWNQERELAPGDRDSFGRQLRSAYRYVERSRARQGGELVYVYKRIRLMEPWEGSSDEYIDAPVHDTSTPF